MDTVTQRVISILNMRKNNLFSQRQVMGALLEKKKLKKSEYEILNTTIAVHANEIVIAAQLEIINLVLETIDSPVNNN